MLIEKGTLDRDSLKDQVAVVTGAGRGIGLETARALLCLGACVVIAEIDEQLAHRAETELGTQFDPARVLAIPVDVGDEAGVRRMARKVIERFGRVDIVINNATVTPMGAVWDVPIDQWDHSYRVNLRGPVLLAQQFIPEMIKRNRGVFACVSSVGQAYMGAYESFKMAQTHLANTLDAELEETDVCAFTIGPGLVRTPGADAGIKALAPLYGKTVDEFYDMSREHLISAEEAGTGFAAAAALAPRFRGQEINSRHALVATGIPMATETTDQRAPVRPAGAEVNSAAALAMCRRVLNTLKEQSEGWSKRSLFERQWMFRDFKKNAGMPVEQWLKALSGLEEALEDGDWDAIHEQNVPVGALARYYEHLMILAQGYEKDPAKQLEQKRIMQGWIDEANSLAQLLN
jgi:NAD(P)-dependent dehydrogenase (short-subunit alcohol dehydrogenase family)